MGTWTDGFTAALQGKPLPEDANAYYRLGFREGMAAEHGERRAQPRPTPLNYTAPEGYANDPAFD